MGQDVIILEDNPLRRSILRFDLAGLNLVRTHAGSGYFFVAKYLRSVANCLLTSKHFVVSGKYQDPLGILPDRVPGWLSGEDPEIAPAGTWRREFPTETVMWCIRPLDLENGRTDHVRIVRLQDGQECVVEPGLNLLVAEGNCRVQDRVINAFQFFRIGQESRTLVSQGESYLVIWPTLGN
jgi:hypothetical protein